MRLAKKEKKRKEKSMEQQPHYYFNAKECWPLCYQCTSTVLSIFIFDQDIRLTACDAFKVLMQRQQTVSPSTLYYVLKNLAEVGVLRESSINDAIKHYSLNTPQNN